MTIRQWALSLLAGLAVMVVLLDLHLIASNL